MKILFITSALGIDYLSDCIYHGLVKNGHDVIDSKYLWYLSQPLSIQQKLRLYGRGFTLSGNLQDRSQINRDNLSQRILLHEFDLIVYGSITRCKDYLHEVKTAYKRSEVLICDGEDNTLFDESLNMVGICFKRELLTSHELPISFAIPEEKILAAVCKKEREVAQQIPGTQANYLYVDEQLYYHGYATSMFGMTKKKGGWDCLRHYEIAANNCLPVFENYENCPKMIMTNWPHDLQVEANELFATKNYSRYDKVVTEFFNYCKTHLTTKHLADYVVSKAF